AGSFGTLAVMTELTVRALPVAERTRTVLLKGLDDAAAMQAMSQALGSAHEVSGAAPLPAAVAARSRVEYVRAAGAAVTALRVEGPGPCGAAGGAVLRAILGRFADAEELHARNSAVLWREVRDVTFFAEGGDGRQVWRLSVPPMQGAKTVARIAEVLPAEAFYDWGGGL